MSWFKRQLVVTLLLTAATAGNAQEAERGGRCGYVKNKMEAKTTVIDAAEENYDIKYLKFDIAMTNTSTHIAGNVLTRAVVKAPSLAAYVFELNAALLIDSILVNGSNLPFTSIGDLRTVALSPALSGGTLFAAQVFYHGTPASGTASAILGINCLTSPSWGTRATFTLSESYHAKEWWPCKQSLHDKIDSMDMWITVADSLKAGSNGLLTAITPIDATHNRYEWKERYPIDYYLVSAAVGPYVDYSYYMHYTGSTDSTLVQNYVYNNPATLPYFKSTIDSTGMMMDYFSQLYGRYPFWKEKYGHSMGRLSGGMEHETMTTLGFFEGTLVAHELGHQWFGDNVTCATWSDIVMNEGFASYTEYLYIDHFWSHGQALSDMQGRHTNVKSIPGGTIFVTDTASEGTIFDSRLSYDKGACVLHMLRSVINNDSMYFQVYKTYQQQMKDSTGTIMDFLNTTKSIVGATPNGVTLDTFFNQWMYLQGYPLYTVSWNQIDADVYVKIDQSTAVPASVSCFTLPIEIKLHSATSDTLVRVNNTLPSQIYHFTWGNAMSSLVMDPNYWLLYNLLGVTHDVTLNTRTTPVPQITIAPNPATTGWNISNLPAGSSITVCDISGRTVWQADNTTEAAIAVPAQQLATGLYLLKVSNSDAVHTYKLVKE